MSTFLIASLNPIASNYGNKPEIFFNRYAMLSQRTIDNLAEAKTRLRSLLPISDQFVILELDESNKSIKKVHLDHFEVEWRPETSLAEIDNLLKFQTQFHTEKAWKANNQINSLLLKNISPELRYLLLIDYQFINAYEETWLNYDAREPGCFLDLFTAFNELTKIVLEKKSFPVTLESVQEIHKLLSKSTLMQKNYPEEYQGGFRKTHQNFLLTEHTTTIEGIEEFLTQMQKDNQLEGFVIAPLFNVERIYFDTLREIAMDAFNAKEPFLELPITDAFWEKINQRTYEALISKDITITREEMDAFIKQRIDKEAMMKEILSSSTNWLSFGITCLNKFRALKSKDINLDAEFSRKYANKHAALTSDMSAADIKKLAKEIYDNIISRQDKNQDKNFEELALFAPLPELAQKQARQAINNYNEEIQNAKTTYEVISVIDTLCHKLEILHLFHDCNCRTTYLLCNFLLMKHLGVWSTQYNPNRNDLFSKQQRIEQIIQGICRTQFILENQEMLKKQTIMLQEKLMEKEKPERNLSYAPPSTKNAETKIEAKIEAKMQNYERLNETFEKICSHTSEDDIVESYLTPNKLSEKNDFGSVMETLKSQVEYLHFADQIPLLEEVFKKIKQQIKLHAKEDTNSLFSKTKKRYKDELIPYVEQLKKMMVTGLKKCEQSNLEKAEIEKLASRAAQSELINFQTIQYEVLERKETSSRKQVNKILNRH